MRTMTLFFRPARVAAGLSSGTLSEAQKARLVLLGYIVNLVLGGRSLAGVHTLRDAAITAFYVVVVISGFWGCFKANQQGDGRSFVERYTCIGVSLGVLLYGGYTLLFYVAWWVLHSRAGYDAASYSSAAQPYFAMLSLVTVILFFAILRRLITRVASVPAV